MSWQLQIRQIGLRTPQLVERATDERAAHFKKTQRPMDLTRDADAQSGANVRGFSNRSAKPKRAAGTQVNAVEPPVDLQGSGKASRASRQVSEFVGFAEALH